MEKYPKGSLEGSSIRKTLLGLGVTAILITQVLGCNSGKSETPTGAGGNGEPLGATQLASLIQGKGGEELGVGLANGGIFIDGIPGGPGQYMRTCVDTEDEGAWRYYIDTPFAKNKDTIGTHSRPTDAWLEATGLTGPKNGEVNRDFPTASLERVGDNCPNIGQPLVLGGNNVVRSVNFEYPTPPTPVPAAQPTAGPACEAGSIPASSCPAPANAIGNVDSDPEMECINVSTGTVTQICPKVY